MIVTKEQMIKAVQTEPLRAGEWYSVEHCEMCAVGAVLRAAGVNTCDINATGWTNVVKALNTEYYNKDTPFLERLSGFFEEKVESGYMSRYNDEVAVDGESAEYWVPDIRKQLVEFINKYAPESITIKGV